ncbi:MAG: hypothetical protein N2489_00195 [Clostridia bacterium]|nr:hypothetical protein [Clostridia bacterium]
MISSFETATLKLYGKEETVQYLCMDLIWKPLGRKLRFVMVKTKEKSMNVACSNLNRKAMLRVGDSLELPKLSALSQERAH